MKRKETKRFSGLFLDTKPILIIFFLVMITCALKYFTAASYANGNSKLTLLSASVNTARQNMDNAEKSDSESNNQWKTVQMRVTAYCPCPKCCGEYSDGVTANGHKISQGDRFVAADSRYPFNTEMIIPGYNNTQLVEVLDRGGAIKGNRLDVFFNSHQQALEWGVRYLDVKIRYQ